MQRQATMKRAVVVHFGSAPSFRGGDARWCAEDKEHKQTTMARGGVKRKKKKTTSLARRAGAPIFFQTKRAPCLTQKNKTRSRNTTHPIPPETHAFAETVPFFFFLILSFPAFHPSSFLFFPPTHIYSHAHAHTLKLRECTRTSSNTNTTPFTHFHQHILSHHVEGGAGGGLGKRELARNDDAVFTITTRSTHIHTQDTH